VVVLDILGILGVYVVGRVIGHLTYRPLSDKNQSDAAYDVIHKRTIRRRRR